MKIRLCSRSTCSFCAKLLPRGYYIIKDVILTAHKSDPEYRLRLKMIMRISAHFRFSFPLVTSYLQVRSLCFLYAWKDYQTGHKSSIYLHYQSATLHLMYPGSQTLTASYLNNVCLLVTHTEMDKVYDQTLEYFQGLDAEIDALTGKGYYEK